MTQRSPEERSRQEQTRRRAFQKNVPEHFCRECSTLAYADDQVCFYCGFERPRTGWPSLEESGDPWLGRVVEERYLFTRRISQGRRARVYQADSRIIPRSFAVKIMDVTEGPEIDAEELRNRLRGDVSSLSALRNPHVVGFYDVFDIDDRHLGFVMDLVQGDPLDELLAEAGSFDMQRTAGLARQLANGLFEAHQRGLLHQNLKPSNVMIERLPAGDDFVRILDFGVVWVRGTVQDTGALDHKPVFSSPELIEGQPVDERADLYSIGALVFYMLTGRPPFSGSSVMETVDAIILQPAPTLKEATGHEFPQQLEDLLADLLAKNPDDRPQSASEVIDAIDALGEEVLGPPTNEFELEVPGATGTAMGMIPTVDRRSTPQAAVISHVSEVEAPEVPRATACRSGGYACVWGDEVFWAGDWEGAEPGKLPEGAEITSMAVTKDLALLGTADGRILQVAPGDDAIVSHHEPDGAEITAVALTTDGQALLAGASNGRAFVSRGDDWIRLGRDGDPISAIALNDSGDQFAIARDGEIQLLSLHASNLSGFPAPEGENVTAMAFSGDDYLVAMVTDKGTVVLGSVHTGQEFMRFTVGDIPPSAVTFSADNHLMGLFVEEGKVVLRALS